MTTGTKRGQFMRSSSGSIPCLTPTYAFVIIAALFCLVGYHSWSQSHRMDSCRLELARMRGLLHEASQRKLQMEGRLTELHNMMDRRTKLLTNLKDESRAQELKSENHQDDKDKRILSLENELVQTKEKLEKCSNGLRDSNDMSKHMAQSKTDDSDTNIRGSTGARNKSMCDLEMIHQYEEIDKWIKSMVDDRTYSQFQLKFSRDGEKNEADKLQKLEKVVRQRDEIKAVKDESIKEEIRARESKAADQALKKPMRSQGVVQKTEVPTKKLRPLKPAVKMDVEERNH